LQVRNTKPAPPARRSPGDPKNQQASPRGKPLIGLGRPTSSPTPGLPKGMSDAPSPPAPLLSPRDLGLLAGGAFLGWLWNLLNGRSRPPISQAQGWEKTWANPIPVNFSVRRDTNQPATLWCPGTSVAAPATSSNYTSTDSTGGSYGVKVVGPTTATESKVCGGGQPNAAGGTYTYTKAGDGNWYQKAGVGYQVGPQNGGPFWQQGDTTHTITINISSGGVPILPPVIEPQFPFSPPLPAEAEPLPLEDPQRQTPAPLAPPFAPPQAPPAPEPLPAAPPTPGPDPLAPGQAPAPGWVPWPGWVPAPVVVPPPAGQPLPNDGTVVIPVPLPVPTTPPTVEDFLGQPIGQPGTAPPPTLEGIAGEVGKIEQKLRILGEKPDPPPTDLTDILQLLGELLQLLSSGYDAGSYEISSPCERDANGQPLPPEVVQWPGGVGRFAQVNEKLDALAELLQLHKNLRQPTCMNTKPTGREVTVQFQEQ
jgi:hypothetical protein